MELCLIQLLHQGCCQQQFSDCCSYIAGQQPKRQKVVTSAPDLPRAQQLMTQYLEGSLAAPPWDAMGVSKAPVIGGMSQIWGLLQIHC